jgi:probable phosphoglycerate mutase
MHLAAAGSTCPRSTTIILARHGESEYSARGRLNGDITVAVGLTERGREEARRLGTELRSEPLDLCVTSEFQRVRETADIVLEGRDVARKVDARLNDPLLGRYEGAYLEEYRSWAAGSASSTAPEQGGESRLAIVTRYAAAFRDLLERQEETILVVCHSLPVSYALAAREGRQPGVRMPMAHHATPYPFTAKELDAAVRVLEAWAANPTW